MIIEKPFGTSLAGGARAQPPRAERLRRGSGLPHRPLPGQGDGPEHDGVPLRQRHVRAAVEPQLHRHTCRSPRPRTSASARRAGYYDQAGALRDLIQNHMLQLLCHVAMEPPVSFTAEEVRNEKVKVLHAIHEPTLEEIPGDRGARPVRRRALRRRGRAGLPAGGGRARGIDAPRPSPRCAWKSTTGAGRASPSTCARASAWRARSPRSPITLKPVPHLAFSQDGSLGVKPNQLVLTLQPNEGVSLQLGAKIPGHAHESSAR